MKIRLFLMLASVLLLAGVLFPSSTPAGAKEPTPIPGTHPMIFVHGGSGVGAQFESQSQRFESNGYPADWVTVYEYDSSFSINTITDVYNGIDQAVATLLAKTGADQVDILGHSLGTTVMVGGMIATTVTPGWLNTSAERAAKVAHYVNIDGRTATELPGTVVGVPVPTLAIWAGRGTAGREIVGATNVTIPNQTHVQSATSAESFVEMYKFFAGNEPATMDIVPQPPGQVRLSGRAVFFPTNSGVPSGTLQIWRVNGDTGARLEAEPEAVYPLSGDGSWGPFEAVGGKYYEFAIVRAGQFTHHFYYEPFLRSDHLIRLQTEPPGTGLGLYTDVSDNTTALIILRNKELWGDQGAENDTLTINGTNVVNAATCPITKRVNAVFTFDKHLDGMSDVTTGLFPFTILPFLLGVDLYIPGVTPPNATVPVVLTPRGGGDTQTINVPNWASLTDRVTLQFHDYSQDINSWQEYVSVQREYLALGDSLGWGYGASDPATKGYVPLFHDFLGSKDGLHRDLLLDNLSIPGATSTSLISQQLPTALAELEARNGDERANNDVKVVTVDIGGNDLLAIVPVCAGGVTPACIATIGSTFTTFSANFDSTLDELRTAAGPDATIIVMTYYNSFVGLGCPLNALEPLGNAVLEGNPALGLPLGANDLIRSIAAAHGAKVAELVPGGVFPALLGPSNILPDCVHANDSGYQIIADAFADAFEDE